MEAFLKASTRKREITKKTDRKIAPQGTLLRGFGSQGAFSLSVQRRLAFLAWRNLKGRFPSLCEGVSRFARGGLRGDLHAKARNHKENCTRNHPQSTPALARRKSLAQGIEAGRRPAEGRPKAGREPREGEHRGAPCPEIPPRFLHDSSTIPPRF